MPAREADLLFRPDTDLESLHISLPAFFVLADNRSGHSDSLTYEQTAKYRRIGREPLTNHHWLDARSGVRGMVSWCP